MVYVTSSRAPTIEPLTAENLVKLGLAPTPPEMQVLSTGLFAIGPLWIAAALALLLVQNILELRIQRKEVTRNRRTVTRRKDYDMLNKKESILTYIDDLQGLIK
jgi:hypothetical protein